jgi:MFS family permease
MDSGNHVFDPGTSDRINAAQTRSDDAKTEVTLRELFAVRRGRLLLALLVAEFGGAVQSIAYSSVLPITARDLHGTALFGATLGAGTFTTILVLAVGPAPFARFSPRQLLLWATVLYLVGTAMCVVAPAMVVVLLGVVVRGLAGGMLAGLGLSTLGGLFEGEARVRAYGLFALAWLLPSVAGPVVNTGVTVAGGWRAALAWPAALVLLGRLLIGRDIDLVPWSRSQAVRPSPVHIVVLLAGLLIAGAAGPIGGGWGVALLVLGCVAAAAATIALLDWQIGPDVTRRRRAVLMFLISLAFFGGGGIESLAAIDGLGYGVVAGSAAVGAGLLAWSLTGLRPSLLNRWTDSPERWGIVLVGIGLACGLVANLVLAGATALGVLVAGWSLAGTGMGFAYPYISSGAVADLARDRLYPVASAVELAETSGTAIAAFVGGGTYSVARSMSVPPAVSLGWSFGLLLAVAAAGLWVAVGGKARIA